MVWLVALRASLKARGGGMQGVADAPTDHAVRLLTAAAAIVADVAHAAS